MEFLKYPVLPFYINQNFGDDMACLSLKDRKTTIFKKTSDTCPVGYESLYVLSGMKGHNGLDLRAYHKQPIYSCSEGYVEEMQLEESRGLGLGIVTENKYICKELDGKKVQFKIRYWHMDSFCVQMGDKVKVGDLIGYADNTGYSSGDHLHLELKPISIKNGKVTNILQNNGFFGAVNPLPYFDELKLNLKKDLSLSSRGNDVIQYQRVLVKEECLSTTALNESISLGGIFGRKTFQATVQLQEKYANEILKPANLTKGTGYVGISTRRFLNAKYK